MELNFIKLCSSILVVEKQGCYLEPFVNNYLKLIVCSNNKNNYFCNNCINCLKINNENYYDLIVINGLVETISKEKILSLQNQFMYPGLEKGNKKIYIIKQIEKSTKEAANSLLKFLESPPLNTYAILTTRNENLVLATIKSRCQKYFLSKNKNFDWNDFSKKYQISTKDLKKLFQTYWSIDDLILSVKNKDYLNMLKLIDSLLKKPKDIKDLKFLQDSFKQLSYNKIELILNYLLSRLSANNHEEIFKLLSVLHLNPIKNAIFWEIIKLVEDSNE